MFESIPETTESTLEANDRQLWLKALSSIQQNNEAYAVNLLLPVVTNNPGFLEARKTLRKCQAVAAGSKSSGGTKVFGLSIGGGSKGASSKTKSLAKKDPTTALGEIEKELGDDPHNAELNDLIHDCAAALGMIGTAEFALETVHKHAPSNTKILHKLASFYVASKKFTEAAKVYQTIAKEDPTDSTAVKGEKDCMAKASMQSSTETAADGSVNLKMRDDSLRVELEKQSKTGLTKEQLGERRDQLIAAYNQNQNDLGTVQSLAETYEQLDDFPNAYTFYSWAYQLSENDKTIQNKASDMKSKADKINIEAVESALAADPTNADLQAQLKELKSSTLAERIADCEARVEQNPTDGLLRYDLGKAYYEAERFGDAIPHLQQAKTNPAIETKVLLLLGQTFDAKGMTDMAIDQLNNANERIVIMDGIKKETLYQLALLHEKTDNKEQYIECLKEIYSADYGYRDVAQRVESSY